MPKHNALSPAQRNEVRDIVALALDDIVRNATANGQPYIRDTDIARGRDECHANKEPDA